MGEIEAAIGYEQLKKLDKIVLGRQKVAKKFTEGLGHLQGPVHLYSDDLYRLLHIPYYYRRKENWRNGAKFVKHFKQRAFL